MWIKFTNGTDSQMLLYEQLSKKLQDVVIEADKREEDDNDDYHTVFVDMDLCRLREVLNHYRNGQTMHEDRALQHDLKRFEEALNFGAETRVKMQISHRTFYTTRTTLSQSPYFSALFSMSPERSDVIARDPVLFEQILSHLRNPIAYPLTELAASAPEELAFYQLDKGSQSRSNTVKTSSSQNVDKIWPEMHVLAPNATMPDIFVCMPEISYFRSTFRRFTQHQRNTLVWSPSSRAGKNDNVVFYGKTSDIDTEREQPDNINIIPDKAHVLEGMHLTFERLTPITCLADLFEGVEIEFRCPAQIKPKRPPSFFPGVNMYDAAEVSSAEQAWWKANPPPLLDNSREQEFTLLKFSHSADFMDAYSDLRQMPSFNVHQSDNRFYIAVPLHFFFCENTGKAFHLHNTVSSITVRVFGCKQEIGQVDNTAMQLCCDVFKLAEDERAHLFDLCDTECLIEDSHHFLRTRLPLQKHTFHCQSPHVVRYFLFSLYDGETGERVKAALKGTLTVEDRTFPIDPFINQMNQYRHFGGHTQQMHGAAVNTRERVKMLERLLPAAPHGFAGKQVNYDPYIWLISFGTLSCVGNEPSGHEFIGADKQFTLDLSCDRKDVIIDAWMCTYNVLTYRKNGNASFTTLNIDESEDFFLHHNDE